MKKALPILALIFLTLFTSSVYASEIYYYHNDHLGRPIAMTNHQGQVVWQANYSTSEQTVHKPPHSTLNYKCYEKPSSPDIGIYQYGADYYNPLLNPFTIPHTTTPTYLNTQPFNNYIYQYEKPFIHINKRSTRQITGEISHYYNQGAQLSVPHSTLHKRCPIADIETNN